MGHHPGVGEPMNTVHCAELSITTAESLNSLRKGRIVAEAAVGCNALSADSNSRAKWRSTNLNERRKKGHLL